MRSNSGCSRRSHARRLIDMSISAADEAVIDRARQAITAARLAEHALLTVIAELGETAAWTTTGHRDLGRFLEELWRVDHAHAAHLLRHAEQTQPLVALSGQDLPPRLPASARAAAEGAIGE